MHACLTGHVDSVGLVSPTLSHAFCGFRPPLDMEGDSIVFQPFLSEMLNN